MHNLDGIDTLERLCRLIRDTAHEQTLASTEVSQCVTVELVGSDDYYRAIHRVMFRKKPQKPNYLKITFGILHDTVDGAHIDYDRVAEITVFEWTGERKQRLWLSGSPIWAEERDARVKLAAAGNNPLRDVCRFYEVAGKILRLLDQVHADLNKE